MNDSEILTGNQAIKPIQEVAVSAGIAPEYLELYGKYKAKVNLDFYETIKSRSKGKLIYVTCITPTPAGEGKTLTSIGLCQAMGELNKKVFLCLREPSLGPVFGNKGGATGGGKSQLFPMTDINLHFTGDIHAISSAHNLLAAVVDNHIFRGNELNFDVSRPKWRRVVDMNDRAIRDLSSTTDDELYGKTGFDITASSEIMAIMSLSSSIKDLKNRLSNMIVGYNKLGSPIRVQELNITGSLALLLLDALKPNLVQTIEGQPVFVHCGPFANIAHGNSSIIATKIALSLSDYVITEGGFSSDLGAEKFFDIVCPTHNVKPDVAVLVCSIKALNLHGGADKHNFNEVNLDYLTKGLEHLNAHIEILKKFGVPVVVAINKFDRDTNEEISLLLDYVKRKSVRVAVSDAFAQGGLGAVSLAQEIIETLHSDINSFKPLYNHNLSIQEKIEKIAKEIYGAEDVEYSSSALSDIEDLTHCGFDKLPICMAKTQFSLSDNSQLKGVPKSWKLFIRQIKISNGAGFLICIAGNIMLMPGLPKTPAACQIHVDDFGNISGLK